MVEVVEVVAMLLLLVVEEVVEVEVCPVSVLVRAVRGVGCPDWAGED